jgi:hypothetical protein
MTLIVTLLFLFATSAAADYLELNAYADSTCEGSTPLIYMARGMDTVVCINSTYWTSNSGSDAEKGFICDAPTGYSPYGNSSSFLCSKGEYNYTRPQSGVVLSVLPSRETCAQQPDMIQEIIPEVCIPAGGEGSIQTLCDIDGVIFNRFNNTICAGTAFYVERYAYGCNLTADMSAQITECMMPWRGRVSFLSCLHYHYFNYASLDRFVVPTDQFVPCCV